jgi:hypothetical protein
MREGGKQRYIVAEISKNWFGARPGAGDPSEFVRQKFEEVLEVNRRRGYRLHSFAFHRLMTGPAELNETIVAVFEAE